MAKRKTFQSTANPGAHKAALALASQPQAKRSKRAPSGRRAANRLNAADKAVMLALEEWRKPVEPRTRMRLRAAMHKLGLDEWKIAWLLNFKIHLLAESRKSSDNKLLLDYLKEAARHLDPASLHNRMQDAMDIEVIHNVPRPNRDDSSPE